MPSRLHRTAAAGLAGLLVVLTGATACSGGDDDPAADATTYVALGDSYTAAPGVPTSEPADGCFRSTNNYPHLVAAADDLALTDVSCSGATSDDILDGPAGGPDRDPQIDAVRPDTDLVTVSIGGNDLDLFSSLIGQCTAVADQPGSPCADEAGATTATTLAGIEARVGAVLAAITDVAPDARVVVVGYPQLLPTRGSCPDLVGFAPGDYDFVNGVNRGLGEALAAAAATAGVDFVDVYAASKGHDICSDDPWVNGQDTAADGTFPYHPFAAGQRAVAELLTTVL